MARTVFVEVENFAVMATSEASEDHASAKEGSEPNVSFSLKKVDGKYEGGKRICALCILGSLHS